MAVSMMKFIPKAKLLKETEDEQLRESVSIILNEILNIQGWPGIVKLPSYYITIIIFFIVFIGV